MLVHRCFDLCGPCQQDWRGPVRLAACDEVEVWAAAAESGRGRSTLAEQQDGLVEKVCASAEAVSGAAGLAVKPVGCRATFSPFFPVPPSTPHLLFGTTLGGWGGGGISSKSKGRGFRPLRPEELQN